MFNTHDKSIIKNIVKNVFNKIENEKINKISINKKNNELNVILEDNNVEFPIKECSSLLYDGELIYIYKNKKFNLEIR